MERQNLQLKLRFIHHSAITVTGSRKIFWSNP
ncbi:UNVERIFIED_ORG: hypothetical protein ABIB52_003826 [Arthrobacter sp. UYCu721]